MCTSEKYSTGMNQLRTKSILALFWSKSGNLLEDFFEVETLKVIVSIFGSFVHVYIIPPICASNIYHPFLWVRNEWFCRREGSYSISGKP